jgi:hypothetical protein
MLVSLILILVFASGRCVLVLALALRWTKEGRERRFDSFLESGSLNFRFGWIVHEEDKEEEYRIYIG